MTKSKQEALKFLSKYGLDGSNEFRYQMLDRMRSDCAYYLGNGRIDAKQLWANNVKDHIRIMKELYNSFERAEKPQWISMKDIKEFERLMLS